MAGLEIARYQALFLRMAGGLTKQIDPVLVRRCNGATQVYTGSRSCCSTCWGDGGADRDGCRPPVLDLNQAHLGSFGMRRGTQCIRTAR